MSKRKVLTDKEIDKRCNAEQSLRLRALHDTAYVMEVYDRAAQHALYAFLVSILVMVLGGLGLMNEEIPFSATILNLGAGMFIGVILLCFTSLRPMYWNYEMAEERMKKMAEQLEQPKEDFEKLFEIDPRISIYIRYLLPKLFPVFNNAIPHHPAHPT